MQFTTNEQATISQAISILESKILDSETISSSSVAIDLLRLKLATKEHEVFFVMFLTTQYQVIELNEMFRGTINSASVYPREIAKRALELNAAAVILSHNHPSNSQKPSQADIDLTKHISKSLALFEINTLDHIIVTRTGYYSFAESGLL